MEVFIRQGLGIINSVTAVFNAFKKNYDTMIPIGSGMACLS